MTADASSVMRASRSIRRSGASSVCIEGRVLGCYALTAASMSMREREKHCAPRRRPVRSTKPTPGLGVVRCRLTIPPSLLARADQVIERPDQRSLTPVASAPRSPPCSCPTTRRAAADARVDRHLVRARAHHRRHDAQGWDVQLTAYAPRDWRANFFPVGIADFVVGDRRGRRRRGGRCSGRRAPSVHGTTRSSRRGMSSLYLRADSDQRPSQRAAADRRRRCRDGSGTPIY